MRKPPGIRNLATALAGAAIALASPGPGHAQQATVPAASIPGEQGKPLEVEVINNTTKTLCAEHDNVHVDFRAKGLRQFDIQVTHPVYIATVNKERAAFDLTSCTFRNDPVFAAEPRKKTFWETNEFWLVGYTFPGFWRPNDVPFRVGDTVEKGFHLVQLWMLHRERAEEVLVVYPPDGYWRARPLPFEDLRWTAYGSSFLAGPVEVNRRPLVRLKEIVFDPRTRTFTMHYLRGGTGKLRLHSVDQKQMTLQVSFSADVPDRYPFAALRSMYVTEANSDVARVAWRRLNGKAWSESLISEFRNTVASEIRAGRTTPSRHNLSAPDFVFKHFLGRTR